MPTAVVLANRDDADPGLIGATLAEHGYRLEPLVREDAAEWRDGVEAGADLLLVLGSAWSVYSESVQAAVERECTLVAGAVAQDLPVLAICFGAQLLAAALGGEARPAPRTELGWLEVVPLDGGSVEPGPWFQFHSDTFTLPPGASLLATSDVGPQAFRSGSALAVQFHPEVTPEIVGRWAASDPAPLAEAGVSAEELVDRTAAEQPRAREAARRLVANLMMRR